MKGDKNRGNLNRGDPDDRFIDSRPKTGGRNEEQFLPGMEPLPERPSKPSGPAKGVLTRRSLRPKEINNATILSGETTRAANRAMRDRFGE